MGDQESKLTEPLSLESTQVWNKVIRREEEYFIPKGLSVFLASMNAQQLSNIQSKDDSTDTPSWQFSLDRLPYISDICNGLFIPALWEHTQKKQTG